MAYCRVGDAGPRDTTCRVYMYKATFGGFQFHITGIPPQGFACDFNVPSLKEAYEICAKLQYLGLGIPEETLDRLLSERVELWLWDGEDENPEQF